MHNKVQDHGEFLRCVDEKCVLVLRRIALPPFSGQVNLDSVFFWNDWEKGICLLCNSIGYNRARLSHSV